MAAGGGDIDQAISLAAAVELVHSATLVHDDINDHSLTRRGKVSVHAQWGRTFALLTGDYLFTKVYELMAPYDARLNTIMAAACVRLVEGETLQASAAKDGQIDRETYLQIISLKTASLFEASARMGALLANSDAEIAGKLAQFGYHLGMAFQIVDDVLDIIGSEDAMGKPVGRDLVQGSGAVLAQNGQSLRAKIAGADGSADPLNAMIARLRNSGAVEAALSQAREMAQKMLAGLSQTCLSRQLGMNLMPSLTLSSSASARLEAIIYRD